MQIQKLPFLYIGKQMVHSSTYFLGGKFPKKFVFLSEYLF